MVNEAPRKTGQKRCASEKKVRTSVNQGKADPFRVSHGLLVRCCTKEHGPPERDLLVSP
jgi:hypothetical protein